MADRSKLFEHFGPKLLEAIVYLAMNEINILRAAAGLTPRTKDQLISSLQEENARVPSYDWENVNLF